MARKPKRSSEALPGRRRAPTRGWSAMTRRSARSSNAFNAGRLPHAWLITGPRGIGKATLAYRFARFLLARRTAGRRACSARPPPLDVDLAEPAGVPRVAGRRPCRPAARSSVGSTSRPARLRTEIVVDDVRELGELPAPDAGARAAGASPSIDSADEINRNAANALLKMLEEPPPRAAAAAGQPRAGPPAADHPLALPPAGAAAAAARPSLPSWSSSTCPSCRRPSARPLAAAGRGQHRPRAGAGRARRAGALPRADRRCWPACRSSTPARMHALRRPAGRRGARASATSHRRRAAGLVAGAAGPRRRHAARRRAELVADEGGRADAAGCRRRPALIAGWSCGRRSPACSPAPTRQSRPQAGRASAALLAIAG